MKDFKNLYSKWMKALNERCDDESSWTYHIRFRVYQTPSAYAVQFSIGSGGKGKNSPTSWYDDSPYYNKDFRKLYLHILRRVQYFKADNDYAKELIINHYQVFND